jgi:hypothetical protein
MIDMTQTKHRTAVLHLQTNRATQYYNTHITTGCAIIGERNCGNTIPVSSNLAESEPVVSDTQMAANDIPAEQEKEQPPPTQHAARNTVLSYAQ